MVMVEKMNDRVYDRLANVSMLVAVASALLFDGGVLPHIVMGTIGGIAAIASAALYFINQNRAGVATTEQVCAKLSDLKYEDEAIATSIGTSMAAPKVSRDAAVRWAVTLSKREKLYSHTTYAFHHHGNVHLKNIDRAFYGGFRVAESTEMLSPNEVAACAIEIIQQLSANDVEDRWEFHFGPNGLRVSTKKGHPPTERINPQTDLDFGIFGQMPTTTIQ